MNASRTNRQVRPVWATASAPPSPSPTPSAPGAGAEAAEFLRLADELDDCRREVVAGAMLHRAFPDEWHGAGAAACHEAVVRRCAAVAAAADALAEAVGALRASAGSPPEGVGRPPPCGIVPGLEPAGGHRAR